MLLVFSGHWSARIEIDCFRILIRILFIESTKPLMALGHMVNRVSGRLKKQNANFVLQSTRVNVEDDPLVGRIGSASFQN